MLKQWWRTEAKVAMMHKILNNLVFMVEFSMHKPTQGPSIQVDNIVQ